VSASTHRIETLSWELWHRSPEQAVQSHELQERLWRFIRTEGRDCIERVLNRLDVAGRVVSIDRLELDLGRFNPLASDADLSRRLDTVLEDALHRALGHGGQALPPGRDAADHEVDLFVLSLEQGYLPWSLDRVPQGSLSLWLQSLARRQGLRLWRRLERHPARQRLLQRLEALPSPEGLHALLTLRHRFLARALEQLDIQALLPLQARGALSAYAVTQLQHRLRGRALAMLWDTRGQLGATRQRQLIEALQALLSQSLGQTLGSDWPMRLAPMVANHPEQDAVQELVRALIQPVDPPPDPSWEAELARLQSWGAQGRALAAEQRQPWLAQLQQLQQRHPQALAERLRIWLTRADQRRRWALSLDAATLGGLIGLIAPATESPGSPDLRAGAPALHWAESLRQTALRLQRQAPPGLRPGLSRLQLLLQEASLQALARGERLPDTHAGWQRFWALAWQRWLGQPAQPAAPSAPLEPVESAPATPRKSPGADSGGSLLDRTLRSLARQCEQGRWQWPQRLRLARLLSSETACRRWTELFSESRRWQMIRAQFGDVVPALQQRASRLQQWLGQRLREPAAALAEHWRRLSRFLFVQAESPDAASLRRDYQSAGEADAVLSPQLPARSPREPIWVDDAGQVLLAVYAERLFRHLDLTEGPRWRDPQSQARAVLSLQGLCHGDAVRDDCHSVLSRLLCGVAPYELLPRVEPLSSDTLQTLEQLLSAVIGHWKALGRTSVAGLRESFLCRQGRLQQEPPRGDAPPAWRLTVERRGFDVLLDRLPWSFNMIRLPWMEGVLHVDWR
jgi:hypothetical protein